MGDTWNLEAATEEIRAVLMVRVSNAAMVLAACIQEAAPRSKKPRDIRGHMADRIRVTQDGLVATVTVPFPARFLEYGTVKAAANPFIRRTLYSEGGRIESILRGE